MDKIKKYILVAVSVILCLVFAVSLFSHFSSPEREKPMKPPKEHRELGKRDVRVYGEDPKIKKEEVENVDVTKTEVEFQIENPSWEYYCRDEYIRNDISTVSLELVSEEENDITDEEEWAEELDLTIPQLPYDDGEYYYEGASYLTTRLMVTENSDTSKVYCFNFDDYELPDQYNEENRDFIEESIGYAAIENNVLYVSTGHHTYSQDAPHTGYITAIDWKTGEVLWKTAPQVCNSRNFEIIGNVIICGYGFTDENDYLYILNKFNGEVLKRIPLKSQAEYLVAKNAVLYVRTYNRNYEFAIHGLASEEAHYQIVDIGANNSAMLVTKHTYDDGGIQASLTCDVYYMVNGQVENIGTVSSYGTAYPLSYDQTGIYVQSGHTVERFAINEEKGTLELAEGVYETSMEGSDEAVTYMRKLGDEIEEITEEEFMTVVEAAGKATVIAFE